SLFQARDGIRDFHVTGVQTCALPISTFYFVRMVEVVRTNFILYECIHKREKCLRRIIHTLKKHRLSKKLNAGLCQFLNGNICVLIKLTFMVGVNNERNGSESFLVSFEKR